MKNLRFCWICILLILSTVGAIGMPIYDYYFNVDGIVYYTYTLDSGEATVVFSGDNVVDLVIPYSVSYEGHRFKVTSIAESAFFGNKNLKSVNFENVTSIGDEAFKGCTALEFVQIDKVTSFGRSIFEDCTALTSVVLDSITSLPYRTFYNCTNLRSVDLGEVTSIGQDAFARCTSLTSLDLKKVSHIGSYAFERCTALKTMDLKNVNTLNWFCFNHCTELTSIDLGQVTSIPYGAFEECASLTSIDLKGVTTIEQEAFLNCSSLHAIDLQQISTISDKSFMGCSGLEYVNFGPLDSIPTQAFQGCSSLKSLDFKNVTFIGSNAFADCTHLKSINLNQVTTIQDRAFQYCSSLTSLDLKNLTTIPASAFKGCIGLTTLDLKQVTSLGPNAFYGCTGLTSVDFRNISMIPYNAFFGCTGLTTLDMKQVTTIGNHGFDSCTGLTDLQLNHVASIGENAFADCKGLRTISTHEQTPPAVAKNAFGDINYFRATLKVPVGSQSAYQNNSIWNLFANIKETIDLGTTQMTLSCTESGSIQWEDLTFSNGTYNQQLPLGNQVTLRFVPNEGAHLYSVMVDGKEVTSEVQQQQMTFTVNAPLVVQVTFALSELILDDTEDHYSKTTREGCDQVIYRRYFGDTEWQALYLPFAMTPSDWGNDFEFAQINDTRQYDDNQDGMADRTELEAFILSSEHPMEANTPYLIRTKTAGQKELRVADVILEKADEKTYDCTSWFNRYLFQGTYQGKSGAEMYHQNYYTLQEGSLQPAVDSTPLGGFRWYLSVEDRYGQPVCYSQKIKLLVFDENGDLTGIEEYLSSPTHQIQWPADIYSLQGKLVKSAARDTKNLPKGIYLINGQKIIISK